MNSLRHITEEQLRRYYYLEGQISGLPQKIDPNYVTSCINSFSIWNDDWNKSKFELYIKENLANMEIQYENIVKQKLTNEQFKEKVIDILLHMDNSLYVKNIVLNKFKIPLHEYYHKVSPILESQYNFDLELISVADYMELVKLDRCLRKLKTTPKLLFASTDMRINSLSKEFKISTPYGRIKNIHGNNMTPEQQSISQSVNKNKIFEINRKRIEELQKLTSQCERETDKIYQVIQNNINMMSFE
jgi:hypothetical protein